MTRGRFKRHRLMRERVEEVGAFQTASVVHAFELSNVQGLNSEFAGPWNISNSKRFNPSNSSSFKTFPPSNYHVLTLVK